MERDSGPSPAWPSRVLDSWKAIAGYLSRDVRTVMRWERCRGLPVHRLPGGGRPGVYALEWELEAWRRTKPSQPGSKDPSHPEGGSVPRTASVAVLPFATLSARKEDSYFGDGLADEIISELARNQGLHVTARTSSFAFRDKQQDVREIGSRLGVGALLEGSVRRAGNHVRVTVQLVSSEDGYHIWSGHFDRELKDVFAIQDEIARAVSAALRLRLPAKAAPVIRKTTNLEAYQLWLKGRSRQVSQRTYEEFTQAGECFSKAVSLDPEFAAAHLSLAGHSLDMAVLGLLPARQAGVQARAEAEKALALDGNLGEAYATLGSVAALVDFDWPGSEHAFCEALARQPGSSFIHSSYAASVLMPRGRLEEAEARLSRALELDPLSAQCHFLMGLVLYFRRDYDRAEASILTAAGLHSCHPFTGWVYGAIAAARGQFDTAVLRCEGVVQQFGTTPTLSAALGMFHGMGGRRKEAREILDRLEEAGRLTYVSPMHLAWVYLGLGDRERALEWLAQAVEDRDPHVLHLAVKPVYDDLRQDPRFGALLRKMRLADD